MDPPANDADAGVSTTRKSFEILEALKASEGVTITTLAQETTLSKSTVYRHLTTLTDMGYVIERDNRYYIGFRLLEISEQARNRETGYTVAKRKVFELGQETDERAVFIVEEDRDAVYIHRYGSLSDTMIGKRRPLHCMAAGKVILASWPDKAITEFIEESGLERQTSKTITDGESLFAELERVRDRKYAINEEEFMDGMNGVAVPVYTPDDDVLGALSVFGPASRVAGDTVHEELPNLLWDKAGEIKVTLAYR